MGTCTPPYKCGTGGWCGCDCKCIRPCGTPTCCVTSVTFNVRIQNMILSPPFGPCPEFNYVVPFELTTDGCCFNLFESYSGCTSGPSCRDGYTLMEMRTVGAGTLTVTPGKYVADNCHLGQDCDYNIPESNTLYVEIGFTSSGRPPCHLVAGDADGTPLTCEVDDCEGITVYFYPTASWPGTCCCSATVDEYQIGDDIGNGCETPFYTKQQKINQLKRSIRSRIKKVHYKP